MYTILLWKFQTCESFNKLQLIIDQILTLKTVWILKKCTAKPYSFLDNDTTRASDNPFRFKSNLLAKALAKTKNLSILQSKERETLLIQLNILFMKCSTSINFSLQKQFLKIFCSQPVSFDLSKTNTSRKKKIYRLWFGTKKTLCCGG